MEVLFKKMKSIYPLDYNYLKVIDKIPFAVASLSNKQYFHKYFTGIKTITANDVLKTSRQISIMNAQVIFQKGIVFK